MKPRLSQLKLEEFVILHLEHEFIPPENEETNISDIYNLYEIDIDFGLKKITNTDYEMRVKAAINDIELPLPGHSIYIETAGIFKITEKIEDKELLNNLLLRSTLSMQLNFLRTSVANFSSYFPFGKYWLPSIDIGNLIEEKAKKKRTEKKK
jgi:preprotein translocase subunit SecB